MSGRLREHPASRGGGEKSRDEVADPRWTKPQKSVLALSVIPGICRACISYVFGASGHPPRRGQSWPSLWSQEPKEDSRAICAPAS